MKMGLMRIVVLISTLCFVLIYSLLIAKKGLGTALKSGLVGTGISMGYDSYAVMPIPYKIAIV